MMIFLDVQLGMEWSMPEWDSRVRRPVLKDWPSQCLSVSDILGEWRMRREEGQWLYGLVLQGLSAVREKETKSSRLVLLSDSVQI